MNGGTRHATLKCYVFRWYEGIAHNNLDEQSWVGKSGACVVKNREYNGEQRPNISYFIDKSKQDSLPPWQDTDMTPTAFDPNDLPF